MSSLLSSLLEPSVFLSCITCVGDADDPAVYAANMAILFMLALLIPVLGGLVGMIVLLGRREKRFAHAVDAEFGGHSDQDRPNGMPQ